MTDRGNTWTQKEVEILLQLRSEEEIASQLEGTVRDSVVYERLAELMRERGYTRTKKQIISKIKQIKGCFHKVSDHNNRSGRSRKTMAHYELCESIWGHRPCATPVNIIGGLLLPGAQHQRGDESEEDDDDDSYTELEVSNEVEPDVGELAAESSNQRVPAVPLEPRRSKKNKQTAMQAAVAALSSRFDAAEARFMDAEEKRDREQRLFEEQRESMYREAQREMLRDMKNAQSEMMQQFGSLMTNLFASFTANRTPLPPAPIPTPGHRPYTHIPPRQVQPVTRPPHYHHYMENDEEFILEELH